MAIDLEKIHDSPNILDILIQMEDVLDSMDIYVFKNWLDGEVVDGPVIRRYWLDFALKYPKDKEPDKKGALRLIKHGIRVDITKGTEEGEHVIPIEEKEGKPAPQHNVWLVKISIPRRLVVQMDSAQHDFYDDKIDLENVEDAQDDGLDEENINTDEGQQIDPNQTSPQQGPPGSSGPGGPGGMR